MTVVSTCQRYIYCHQEVTNIAGQLQGEKFLHIIQSSYGALTVLKSLEFDRTKFKALKSLNFTKILIYCHQEVTNIELFKSGQLQGEKFLHIY